MTELLQAIAEIVGENVYPSAVPRECQAPFARYDEQRVAIRTFDGKEYETTFNLSVVCQTKEEAARMADAVIDRLDAHLFDGHMVYYMSDECLFASDEKLTTYDIIFKIL